LVDPTISARTISQPLTPCSFLSTLTLDISFETTRKHKIQITIYQDLLHKIGVFVVVVATFVVDIGYKFRRL